jgi:hypothetical protein
LQIEREAMKTIENETFNNETVELDGKGFINCSFTKCNLIFRASSPFGLDTKTLSKMNGVTLEFLDSAALTIQALGMLYKTGGSFKEWAEFYLKGMGMPISSTNH